MLVKNTLSFLQAGTTKNIHIRPPSRHFRAVGYKFRTLRTELCMVLFDYLPVSSEPLFLTGLRNALVS